VTIPEVLTLAADTVAKVEIPEELMLPVTFPVTLPVKAPTNPPVEVVTPETLSCPSVPTEVREELTIPEPRVVEESTSVLFIL
jgi:hypothetical protein